MVRSVWMVGAALMAVLLVGCVPPAAVSPSAVTPATSGAVGPAVTPDTETSPLATPSAEPVSGVAPEVADRAVEWLAGELNTAVGELRLVEAEQVDWTDSCFGWGGPAESCLQAITPGWRILFEGAGQQYEVRSDASGSYFRVGPQGS